MKSYNYFDAIYPDLGAMIKKEIDLRQEYELKHGNEYLLKDELRLREENPVRQILRPNPYASRPQIRLFNYITQYTKKNPSIFFGNLQQF